MRDERLDVNDDDSFEFFFFLSIFFYNSKQRKKEIKERLVFVYNIYIYSYTTIKI